MEAVNAVAEKHGLFVIEDAAQAIGAQDTQRRGAGTTGDMGCFSFFPSKNLGAFGDAGMVVAQDGKLAESLRILRVHGGKPKYYHKQIGGNFRLDALQAAVLRVKLQYLPLWTAARRRNAQRYRDLFEQAELTNAIAAPQDTPGHIYNQFVIRCHERDALQAFLREQGIETEIYYPVPLHLQECFGDLGHRAGDFPRAEAAAKQVLALPIYPELNEEQQGYVVDQLSAFVRQRSSESTARLREAS
jgi:dTDP-4-amino-4,6-dideoxygalactose transaminase